jgi:hypothetical protein
MMASSMTVALAGTTGTKSLLFPDFSQTSRNHVEKREGNHPD